MSYRICSAVHFGHDVPPLSLAQSNVESLGLGLQYPKTVSQIILKSKLITLGVLCNTKLINILLYFCVQLFIYLS